MHVLDRVVQKTHSGLLFVSLNCANFSISTKNTVKKSLVQLPMGKKNTSLPTVPKLNCFSCAFSKMWKPMIFTTRHLKINIKLLQYLK